MTDELFGRGWNVKLRFKRIAIHVWSIWCGRPPFYSMMVGGAPLAPGSRTLPHARTHPQNQNKPKINNDERKLDIGGREKSFEKLIHEEEAKNYHH